MYNSSLGVSVFQHLANCILLPSGLHGFWWKIICGFLVCGRLPFSCYFQDYLLVFFFQQCYMKCLLKISFILFEIHRVSWMCGLIVSPNLGLFISLFFQIFFVQLSLFFSSSETWQVKTPQFFVTEVLSGFSVNVYISCYFQDYHWAREQGIDLGYIKMSQSSVST